MTIFHRERRFTIRDVIDLTTHSDDNFLPPSEIANDRDGIFETRSYGIDASG